MTITVPHLKMEIEVIKETQTEGILEIENLGKRAGNTDERITSRIQEIKENFSYK